MVGEQPLSRVIPPRLPAYLLQGNDWTQKPERKLRSMFGGVLGGGGGGGELDYSAAVCESVLVKVSVSCEGESFRGV